MEERRTSPRKRSFLKGTVYFNNRLSSIGCLIRDFSAEGARLEFAAPVSLPESIELHVPSRDQTLRAQVRWRKDQEAGVQFGEGGRIAEAAGADAGDLGKRVETLEHEVTKLHRLVHELRADIRHRRGED